MNLLDISEPFETYVSVEELPQLGDARRFLLRLTFHVEGATREMTWPWTYSATQEAIDQRNGFQGLQDKGLREIGTFRRHVEYELGAQKGRLYERKGRGLIWASVDQRVR